MARWAKQISQLPHNNPDVMRLSRPAEGLYEPITLHALAPSGPRQDFTTQLKVKGYTIGCVKERHQMVEGTIPKKVLECLGHNSEDTL